MTPEAKKNVDAVTMEVVGNLLLSIAEEVTTIIIKSAYSTNIKERRDVSSGIMDPEGNMVAQAENLAIHLGSLLTFIKELYKRHPKETIKPGDMFIGNDPYNGGGNHLPDIVVAAPAFEGETMIGWVVNMAHHSDIGGKVPGSTSGDATSIYQEGLKLPIIRICENDKVLDNVMDLILANTRVPRERYGDLIAQISANRVGVRRLKEAYARYNMILLDCMEELQNYAERRLRTVISDLKEGIYKFTDYMDNGGERYPDPLPITVTITIKNNFIDFDFTGTCDQVEAPVNVPYNSLLATVFYSLKALLGPDIPSNAGIYRAFKVYAPKGCLVNPVHPAPVGVMIDTCQRLPDVIFGALAPAVPDRILAAGNGACTSIVFTGMLNNNPDQFFIYHEAIAGGSGASKHADGLSGVQVHMTNTSNMPIEASEIEFPIVRIKKYGLRMNSGGAGENRGGLGIIREFEVISDGVSCTCLGDRQKFSPWGLEGGKNGASGAFYHILPDGTEIRLPNKCTDHPVNKGDIIRVLTPGAGGYGDPVKRLPQKVLQDVLEGKVSLESAKNDYKVLILQDENGNLAIDEKETTKLRGLN
ncbi:hydantoinase B/oxoprolinase family protein [Tepidanaerobacter syntrophicus]|uniref:N-methylhydantoinase B n=1 Tax=Tepidanaerobacter syntrophicus TaxID=224999 RepID=A0A0U9HD42_9FIRM|nr:hydantoinase B/oxoprolinase family protein [Tepidanaerobacter syntrophicus]GAQ24720.1 N-methylhydantoinase B [Tepidanaerobacter syntrophicus]